MSCIFLFFNINYFLFTGSERSVNMFMLSLQSYIFCLFFTTSSCELFTAVVDLEKLLHTESEVIKTIDKYIELEEKRLSEIRK